MSPPYSPVIGYRLQVRDSRGVEGTCTPVIGGGGGKILLLPTSETPASYRDHGEAVQEDHGDEYGDGIIGTTGDFRVGLLLF